MMAFGPVAELVKHRPFKARDRQFEPDRDHTEKEIWRWKNKSIILVTTTIIP